MQAIVRKQSPVRHKAMHVWNENVFQLQCLFPVVAVYGYCTTRRLAADRKPIGNWPIAIAKYTHLTIEHSNSDDTSAIDFNAYVAGGIRKLPYTPCPVYVYTGRIRKLPYIPWYIARSSIVRTRHAVRIVAACVLASHGCVNHHAGGIASIPPASRLTETAVHFSC